MPGAAQPSTILVTGGAGFIGSAFIRQCLRQTQARVINVDKLTYAASRQALAEVEGDPRYSFEQIDICHSAELRRVFAEHRPDAVVHLAAESHVDRSIDGPAAFIETNVVGSYTLLEAALDYWRGLEPAQRERFRLLHVSTDEVFGALGDAGRFTEASPYRPSSPYSASKAAADHLARAWHLTYGLPVIVSNCTNNYGPYQLPEKLIPLMIISGLLGQTLPVYGQGENVRDWIHVDDHVEALWAILTRGSPGESYGVGAGCELRNLELVERICDLLDELAPRPDEAPRRALIELVADRPGHDHRYAIDASRLREELGWAPTRAFDAGLRATAAWYLERRDWWQPLFERTVAGGRLGLGAASRSTGSRRKTGDAGLLVLGAGGQIGTALVAATARAELPCTGLTRAELDITRPADVRAAVAERRWALVVNAAAYTGVDRAEAEPEAAHAVNADGARWVAEACAAAGVPLLHLSSDYVFDGATRAAYREDDPIDPLGVYGASKAAGERAVREALVQHVILRTSWVFSPMGHNFVRTMLAADGDELEVVDDQFGCPTAADDVAAAVLTVFPQLATGRHGTYHYCGAGVTSWYDLAHEIFAQRARQTGASRPTLRPVTSDQRPRPARRPARSALDCSRAVLHFGLQQRPWREALADVLETILKG